MDSVVGFGFNCTRSKCRCRNRPRQQLHHVSLLVMFAPRQNKSPAVIYCKLSAGRNHRLFVILSLAGRQTRFSDSDSTIFMMGMRPGRRCMGVSALMDTESRTKNDCCDRSLPAHSPTHWSCSVPRRRQKLPPWITVIHSRAWPLRPTARKRTTPVCLRQSAIHETRGLETAENIFARRLRHKLYSSIDAKTDSNGESETPIWLFFYTVSQKRPTFDLL